MNSLSIRDAPSRAAPNDQRAINYDVIDSFQLQNLQNGFDASTAPAHASESGASPPLSVLHRLTLYQAIIAKRPRSYKNEDGSFKSDARAAVDEELRREKMLKEDVGCLVRDFHDGVGRK